MSEKNSMAHATTRYARYFEIVTQHQVLYWCGVGDCSCQHFLQNSQAGHQHLAHSLQFWHRLRSWKFSSGSVAGPVLRYLPIWKCLLHLATLCFAKFKRVNRGTLGQALICEIGMNSGKALGSLTLGRSKPNKHYSLYKRRRSSSRVRIGLLIHEQWSSQATIQAIYALYLYLGHQAIITL